MRGKSDLGVSEAVSFIFVLVIILLLISGVLLYGVPYAEAKKAVAESDLILQEIAQIVSGMDELVLTTSYGIERNAVLSARSGTLSLITDDDGGFILVYENMGGKEIAFDTGVFSADGTTILCSAGYLPITDKHVSSAVVLQRTCTFTYTLLRIYETSGTRYAEFSVRLT